MVGLVAMLWTNCFAQGFNDESEEEFCQWETFQAKCPGEDEVILVTKAFYGRLRIGRCVQRDFGYVNCGADALDAVGQLCSARRSCSFAVTVLHGNHQCPIDLSGYLVARFTCLKVSSCRAAPQCSRSDYVKVPPSGGYLSSSMRPVGGGSLSGEGQHCGTPHCPWTLEANPGQRIKVTLLDFSADLIKGPTVDGKAATAAAAPGVAAIGSGAGAGSICYRYASVRDGNLTKDLSGCGRDGQGVRRRSSYVSEGSVVQITMYTSHSNNVHFLLRYQTSGCSVAQMPPPNARMKQMADDLIVECLHSDRIWKLKCNGTAWVGPVGSCDAPQITGQTGDEREAGFGDSARKNASLGVVIVVGLGIVIGIIIGFSMLVFLTCCIRRSRHGNAADNPESPVYWKTRSELVYHHGGDLYHCDRSSSSVVTAQSPHDCSWTTTTTPNATAGDYIKQPRPPPTTTVFPPPSSTLHQLHLHHLRQHHHHHQHQHHNRLLECPGRRLDGDGGMVVVDCAGSRTPLQAPPISPVASELDHCNALKTTKTRDEVYEMPVPRAHDVIVPRENVLFSHAQQ